MCEVKCYMVKSKKKDNAPKTINRKIYYYRIDAGVHPDTGLPRKISFGPVFTQLEAMKFDTSGRYLQTQDGKQLCCWAEKVGNTYQLRLAHIRRGQHPPVENNGKLSPLVLASGDGLAEITHLTLFPEGICGAEFNFYGPRPSQLPFYCALKLESWCPAFRLNSLIRPDLMTRLDAITDVKLLDMKVCASYVSVVEQANHDLGSAFKAAIDAFDARPQDEFEIIFKRKKNKKWAPKVSPAMLIEGVKKLALRSDLREQVSTFKIAGGDADARMLDILSEQFMAEHDILLSADQTGGVDSGSMFTAIEESYAQFKDGLEAASELKG